MGHGRGPHLRGRRRRWWPTGLAWQEGRRGRNSRHLGTVGTPEALAAHAGVLVGADLSDCNDFTQTVLVVMNGGLIYPSAGALDILGVRRTAGVRLHGTEADARPVETDLEEDSGRLTTCPGAARQSQPSWPSLQLTISSPHLVPSATMPGSSPPVSGLNMALVTLHCTSCPFTVCVWLEYVVL